MDAAKRNGFQGRTALVTGAGSGISQACAVVLAERGARVLIADIDTSAAERVAGAIGEAATPFTVDVSDSEQCTWTAPSTAGAPRSASCEEAGGGSIVNMASILGSTGLQNAPAYIAAKHGIVGLARGAPLDHAADGIRVSALSRAPCQV